MLKPAWHAYTPESRYVTSKILSAPFFDSLIFRVFVRNFEFLLHRIFVRLNRLKMELRRYCFFTLSVALDFVGCRLNRAKIETRNLPFDRAFDFNLCAKKYGGRSTNFKCNFRFLWIMLNVRCVAGRYRWMFIFGCAWFCIARFLTCRLHAGTQLITTFNFMFLCHDLLAFNLSLFDTTATLSILLQ